MMISQLNSYCRIYNIGDLIAILGSIDFVLIFYYISLIIVKIGIIAGFGLLILILYYRNYFNMIFFIS